MFYLVRQIAWNTAYFAILTDREVTHPEHWCALDLASRYASVCAASQAVCHYLWCARCKQDDRVDANPSIRATCFKKGNVCTTRRPNRTMTEICAKKRLSKYSGISLFSCRIYSHEINISSYVTRPQFRNQRIECASFFSLQQPISSPNRPAFLSPSSSSCGNRATSVSANLSSCRDFRRQNDRADSNRLMCGVSGDLL